LKRSCLVVIATGVAMALELFYHHIIGFIIIKVAAVFPFILDFD
jgi:hypothetical protein